MKLFNVPTLNRPSFSIAVPGSKSLTNRYLLMAALANGKSILYRPLIAEDTTVMKEALIKLGVTIQEYDDKWYIEGVGGSFPSNPEELYLENAGTAVRFLTAACFLVDGDIIITGNARMQERPIADLIEGLSHINLQVEAKNNCPPLTLHAKGRFPGGNIPMSGGTSSQYISALLLVAPHAEKKTTITLTDELVSKPYLDLTIDALEAYGVQVENNNYTSFCVQAHTYNGTEVFIEADASSATYFYGIAALNGTKATVSNAKRTSRQADTAFLEVLEKMGATVEEADSGIIVKGPEALKPLGTIDLNHMPDSAMTVAVLAAMADGVSTLTNIGNLRVKETDRIDALRNEIQKIGITVETTEDSLTIHGHPNSITGAQIATYNDHRMAMCFGMLGTKVENMVIEDPDCTGKTYPTFWDDLITAIT